MSNKTIEIYSYEENDSETKVIISSLAGDEIIEIRQRDISSLNLQIKHGIYIIDGYIINEKHNFEMIYKLNKWAKLNGSQKDCLKKIEIKIVKNGYTIRHYIFNGYLVKYYEYFTNQKVRFNLVLRQYKLRTLDGKANTEMDKAESYIENVTIKNVSGNLIIKPIDTTTTILSGINLAGGVGLLTGASSAPPLLAFIFIAHGTGMVTEFIADVSFVIQGKPQKMGSFNMTRDWFYKPLGEIIKNLLEKEESSIKISDTFGEDIYNMGNLVFSAFDIGGKILKGVKTLKISGGKDILYTIKMKEVKTSFFGRRLEPYRYYGLTPIKSTKKFIEDMGLDIYSTKKGAESMIKNKIKEDDRK